MALQKVFMLNIQKYRKLAKLTQEELAKICDTDPNYIGQIENGRLFPSILYIEQIAGALNIAPYLLFYDKEDVPAGDNNVINQKKYKMIEQTLVKYVTQTIKNVFEKLY